jgi:hypothetical protein
MMAFRRPIDADGHIFPLPASHLLALGKHRSSADFQRVANSNHRVADDQFR